MIWLLILLVWIVWMIPIAILVGKSIGFGMGNTQGSVKTPTPPDDAIGVKDRPA